MVGCVLIAKTNSFIRRIRWKVYYADKKNVNELNKDKMKEMKKNFKLQNSGYRLQLHLQIV